MNVAANRRATELRKYLDSVKVASGCVDCGYDANPLALDFDHVRGEKKILVSFAKSKAQADAEIEKCEVRCSNCHRIKTWERKQEDNG
jgi:transposase